MYEFEVRTALKHFNFWLLHQICKSIWFVVSLFLFNSIRFRFVHCVHAKFDLRSQSFITIVTNSNRMLSENTICCLSDWKRCFRLSKITMKKKKKPMLNENRKNEENKWTWNRIGEQSGHRNRLKINVYNEKALKKLVTQNVICCQAQIQEK